MMEWQPIETAPRDGFFLIFDCSASDYEATVAVVWWEECGLVIDIGLPYPDGIPTHWMPLPPAPEASK